MKDLQLGVFFDPTTLFVNIPCADESTQKVSNFLMQLDQTLTNQGLALHQPIGSDDTDFDDNRYGFTIKSVRDFIEKTIGIVPADLFRLKYLSGITKRELLDPSLGPNESRFTLKPGEQIKTDDAQKGKNLLSKDDVMRRTDFQHAQDVINYFVKNKIRMDGIPPAMRNEKGDLVALEGVDKLQPPMNPDGTPADDDPEFVDLRGIIAFNSYMDICRKYLRTEFEPVVEYATNVGDYCRRNHIDLMERLGKASNFPMTHIGKGENDPATDIAMDETLGDLGHVEGFDEARRAFFLGKMQFANGEPTRSAMVFKLGKGLIDNSTGEISPQLKEAILMADNYGKEVREAEASKIRGRSVEMRKIVLLTEKPIVHSVGGDKKELPGVKKYQIAKPQQDELIDLIIPSFLAQVSKTLTFVSGQTPMVLSDGEAPTDAARALARKISKFTSGFSYRCLDEFLTHCITLSKSGKNVSVEKLLESMKGNYTESLFRTIADADGAQVKEQFEVVDIDQVKPQNMRHPDQVVDFLENYKAVTPLNNLLDDPSATKQQLYELFQKLGIDTESFGWSDSQWNNLGEAELNIVKKHIQKSLEGRSSNFILFAGPGGMGKTTTAMFMAHMLDYGFMMWNMCRSKNKYVGESEKNISASFDFVAGLRDYIILLDEVDHCLSSQGDNDGGTTNNLIGVFKTKMENYIAPIAKKNNLIIISTTNHPEKLEGPIARRLGKDNTITLDYVKTMQGVSVLAEASIDRFADDPAFSRIAALKPVYADALFKEATNASKRHRGRDSEGREYEAAGAPYSNDEIARLFKAWIEYNRTVILKKYGKTAMYNPETLRWVVQKSRRQSTNGSLDMAQIPDGIITGAKPTTNAPDKLQAPGYSPIPPNRPSPATNGPAGQTFTQDVPPNAGAARSDAESTMLPEATANSTKQVKSSDKPKISLMAIADNLIDQQNGLKGLRSMPAMSGMLFKYQSPKILSFWMQDTYMPLDIAFLAADGTVTKVARMIPMSTRPIRSDAPCTMALEVSAGTLERIGCSIGKKAVIDLAGNTVHFE
jgi:uncharacterized membrane protein (UPF0127 family)/ATP-dependent 26S proteasome regulatory subunit